MDRDPGSPTDRHLSSRPARAAGGFAGVRIAAAVGIAAALGGLGAAGVAFAIQGLDRGALGALQGELDERREAGKVALAALDEGARELRAREVALAEAQRAAARGRAGEVALRASLELSRSPEGVAERAGAVFARALDGDPALGLGLVDPASDRVLVQAGLGLARGATLSAALPSLAAALRGAGGLAPAEGDTQVYALGPRLDGAGLVVVARAQLEPLPASSRALAKATSALVNLATAPEPLGAGESPAPIFLLGALAGAVLGGVWARLRVGAPLAATLAAARAFVHGANDARADALRGGRDAREVAREVNALIERAERLKAQGRAARDEDVRAVVLSIEALGRGDLSSAAPEVGEALDPVARAIASARRELLERMEELHRVATETASAAAGIAPGARKARAAASEELEVVRELARRAATTGEEVTRAGGALRGAVTALGTFAEAGSRLVQDVRSTLRASGHRAAELRQGVERIAGLVASSERVGEAIELLASVADLPPGDPGAPTKARLSSAVGQARAAMEAIERDLALLRDELGEASVSLETLATRVPEGAPALATGVTTHLYDTATGLVRAADECVAALRALERAARERAAGTEELERGARVTAELGPRLGALLATFSLGNAFDQELLDRLGRWKREVEEAAATPDGLTEDGRLLVAQVLEAAEQARQRLSRLASATDAALDALRG